MSRSLLREELDRQHDLLAQKVEHVDRTVGDRLGETAAELRYVHEHLEHLEGVALRPPWANLIGGPLRKLDGYTAAFLNYAAGERGYAAQAGLRFPPPVSVIYDEGAVAIGAIAAAVVEEPYALTVAASLAPGAKVLHLGPGGSTLPLSLASLGCAVTVVDAGGYALPHPGLRVLEEVPEGPFELVLALDCLARAGLVEYAEQPDRDLDLLRAAHAATQPGAGLVLSVPLGDPEAAWGHRVYDSGRLERLLEGWETVDRIRLTSAAHGWDLADDSAGEPATGRLLVRARRR